MLLNNTYDFKQIIEFFPNTYFLHPQSNLNVPVNSILWNYSNKLLIRTINIEDGVCTYYAFLKKDENYTLIFIGNDYHNVVEEAKKFWDPKPVMKSINRQEMALEMIEDTIISLLNRDKINDMKKSHFSYIYYGSDQKWHAYYPTNEVLMNFHMSRPQQNQKYIDFINSERFATIRKQWDLVQVVVPGE